jgi:glyoxylase-like metal-dependent hydrolase (beta-lactamase superfamily II)
LRVHCLTTGRVRLKRKERGLRRYLPGGWSDATLPVNAFAVEHPRGLCLFDSGQTAHASHSGYHPRWHPFLWLSRFELGPQDEVPAQLRARGLDPAHVRWVVLSHLHTDHVGGLAAFRHAEVLVARLEWERANGLAGKVRGYILQRWPKGLVPRLVDYGGPAVGPFRGSLDLAGDGSLLLVPIAGHTAGHMGLLVNGEGSRVLLAGDATHTPAELPSALPEIAAWCEDEDVRVLLAHDPAAAGS